MQYINALHYHQTNQIMCVWDLVKVISTRFHVLELKETSNLETSKETSKETSSLGWFILPISSV